MTSTQCRLWMESLDRSCSNGKISKKFEMFVDRSLNASHSRSDLGKRLHCRSNAVTRSAMLSMRSVTCAQDNPLKLSSVFTTSMYKS